MLNFDYQDRTGDSRAYYHGLTIIAEQDSDCSNPWEDSDGLAPLLYFSLGSSGLTSHGDDIDSPLSSTQWFSDWTIARRWRELCAAVGVADPGALEAELKAERKAYGGRLADYRRERLESELAELAPDDSRSWGAACDYLGALESLWRLAGVAALEFQRNGYSQGDSVRGLLVALPSWREAMGIKPSADLAADLESQADLFGAWAFGDCYSYLIEDSDGETLDSCAGYIGSDFEKSGLAEAAQSAADSILAGAKRKREAKLKDLIRNRVPLYLRPAMLEAAGTLESVF